jgi:hypothetical protein
MESDVSVVFEKECEENRPDLSAAGKFTHIHIYAEVMFKVSFLSFFSADYSVVVMAFIYSFPKLSTKSPPIQINSLCNVLPFVKCL